MLGMTTRQRVDVDADPVATLQDAIRGSFEWPADFRMRQYAWFGFWALARKDPNLSEANRRMYNDVVRYLGRLVAAVGRPRGLAIDEQAAGHDLFATMDGAWLHLTTGVEGFTAADAILLCERCVDDLLAGGAETGH